MVKAPRANARGARLFVLLAVFVASACGVGGIPQASAEVVWRGCLTAPNATIARIAPDRVRYCGKINAQSVDALEALLTPADKTLEIASLGGELDAPIDLAEIVRARGLGIVVTGACLSGCASFVFVAGSSRLVRPWGWLGLHNTNTSAALLAENATGGRLPPRDAPLHARAAKEGALYAQLHLNPALLIEPQARIGTQCIVEAGRNQQTQETEYHILSRSTFWTPTRSQWEAYGVSFAGYSPQSARALLRLARTSLPEVAYRTLSIEFTSASLPQAPENVLQRVAWCDGDEG